MYKWLDNLWREVKKQGETIGLLFVAFGTLVIFAVGILTMFGLRVEIGIFNTGIATLSLGLGLIALGRGTKSEEQMRALANLQFDEKVVAMENYMDEFSEPTFSSASLEPEYRKFMWDLRAMTHVARWADETRRREARERLDRIRKHLAGKMDDTRLNGVKRLCDDIWPVQTETIDNETKPSQTLRRCEMTPLSDKEMKFIYEFLPDRESYHHHKEQMAYIIFPIEAAWLTAMMTINWCGLSAIPSGQAMLIGIVSAFWLILHLFMRWQLRLRRLAALQVGALVAVILENLNTSSPEGTKKSNSENTSGRQQRWAWLCTCADFLIPFTRARIPSDVSYPKWFQDKIESQHTGAVFDEHLVTWGSWLILAIMICGIILRYRSGL